MQLAGFTVTLTKCINREIVVTVKGSEQYRSVVIRSRPERKLGGILGAITAFIIINAIAFWAGGYVMSAANERLVMERDQAVSKLSHLDSKYQQASQNLVNSSVGSQIDRQAVEDVRGTVREHRQTIAELNEEISFYKGLMSPTDRERGLSFRSWEVYAGSDALRYQFKLVVQQLAVKHLLLRGAVTVMLVGKQDGVAKVLSLETISEQIKSQNIDLRFKYFQYIEGELELPQGFVAERVDIVAKASKPKAVKIEKQFAWAVQN